jgi:hypothetical protein
MALKVQDVQNKSKVLTEILRAYSTQLKRDEWTGAHFTFKKPPDGWVVSVDQASDVVVELKLLGDKHLAVWLRTKSPRAVDAKADVGVLKWS